MDDWFNLLNALRRFPEGNYQPQPWALGMIMGKLDITLGREVRNHFLSAAFGREIKSSKELKSHEAFGVIMWAQPHKIGIDKSSPWEFSPVFNCDLALIQREMMGQQSFLENEKK
jgi:hypothetical protein